MWLIKLHIAFSILCILTAVGVKVVFKESLRRFEIKGESKKKLRRYLTFFCPIINVFLVIGLFYMAFCSDASAENMKSQANTKD